VHTDLLSVPFRLNGVCRRNDASNDSSATNDDGGVM
jgi:hypothetical protein